MISVAEKMSINAYINKTRDDYLSFMGISAIPDIKRTPIETDPYNLSTSLGSWARVDYDCTKDIYTLSILKFLYNPVCHADYLLFHEYTHVYDIDRLAKKDPEKYVAIKGYIEYHAAQVELMKQLGAKKYTDAISFSMNDIVKGPTDDRTVFESLLFNKKIAIDSILRSGFPINISELSMVMGMVFNHLGRVSVCKRNASDYERFRAYLEDFSVEEQFFGSDDWNIIMGIYHDEMSEEAIDLAMVLHPSILGRLAKKYGFMN